MFDDPKWREVFSFCKWQEEREPGADMDFLGRFQRYLANLEAIVADAAIPAEERETAQATLDHIAVMCKAVVPDAVRALAQIAQNTQAEPAIRAEAERELARATKNMPAASDKLQ